MHSPARAIAFTLWLRHRRAFTAVLASLALAAGLSALFAAPLPDPPEAASVAAQLSFPLTAAACYLVTVFAYAFEAHIESRGSCFPYRMFTLPIRTSALVLWSMLYGTTGIALLWLGAAQFLFRPWGIDVPLFWPALLAAAVLAWTQALLWRPFGLPWLRVAVAALVLTVPVAGTMAGIQLGAPMGYVCAFLAVQLPVAYVTAHAGLAAARRGDVPQWRWLPALPRRAPRGKGLRRSFVSAGRAQVWFEWRRYGLKTPAIVAILMPWFLLPLFFPKNDLIPTGRTLTLALLAPLLAAGMGINTAGKHNPWVKDYYGVPPFTATRPISSAGLVAAKLEMALWCAATAWAVWLALMLPAVYFTGAYRDVLDGWEHWTQSRPLWEVVGTPIVVGVLLFALTWKSLVQGLCINLTGREWVIKGATAANLTAFGLLVWLGCVVFGNPRYQEFLLRALPWVLGAAVTLKAGLAFWVLWALLRAGLVPARTLYHLLGFWVGFAAGLIGLVVWLVPGENVAPASLAAGVVLALPLVRLSATPLALAWDRHR
jgi:hypothetical protein